MAKLRVFVSSTYYDLKHIRNNLESFIESMGYDPVLFESGDIPYTHDLTLDQASYREIDKCNMLILIIGGSYGSPASEDKNKVNINEKMYSYYNSITKNEYEKARKEGIPIFIFVEKDVFAEYQTYKKNRENTSIQYANVDSINIFRLLDDILAQQRNNYVKDFEKFDDIAIWLKEQWSGLFAEFLSEKKTHNDIKTLADRFTELESVAKTLQVYSESLIKKVEPDQYNKLIQQQKEISSKWKLKRFSKEYLIAFLLRKLEKKDIVPEKILKLLLTSKNFKEFLSSISDLSKDFVEEFSTNKKAQEDYSEIKEIYSSMN